MVTDELALGSRKTFQEDQHPKKDSQRDFVNLRNRLDGNPMSTVGESVSQETRQILSDTLKTIHDRGETTDQKLNETWQDTRQNMVITEEAHNSSTCRLPVWEKHVNIIESVKNNRVTIIVGETGSGKTTQIPQMLLQAFVSSPREFPLINHLTLAVTQPRRIAAICLATRVTEEIKKNATLQSFDSVIRRKVTKSIENNMHPGHDTALYSVGGLVGYSVRFQTKCSHQTRIKFVTDGMLLRDALLDPLLKRYGVILVDEAHERSLQTDILLSLLKTLLEKRRDLRIIIMSATLDYRCFTSFYGQGNVLVIPGRQYPVNIYHTLSSGDPLEIVANTVVQVHMTRALEGDILVFLPGQEEIETTLKTLNDRNKHITSALVEFTSWWSLLQKLKMCLKDRESYWREFLAGKWEQSTRDATLSNHAEKTDHVDTEKHPHGSSDTHILGQLKRSFAELSGEELVKLEQCRLALQTHLTPQTSRLTSDSFSSKTLHELFMMASPCFIVGEPNHVHLFSKSFKNESSSLIISSHYSMTIIPLYASLSLEKQQVAFQAAPPGTRKVILATNIAETSLTIPGVKYVIDSGLFKQKTYNPITEAEILKPIKISRAMANQRSGRAGRQAPGECFRLYSEEHYYSMSVHLDPEIKRADLCQVILQLKILGVEDILKFPFICPPSHSALQKAQEKLKRLGAIEFDRVTDLGKKIAALPLAPDHAAFLLNSIEMDCTAEALTVVAFLSSESIFTTLWNPLAKYRGHTMTQEPSNPKQTPMLDFARKKIVSIFGDHITLLNAYNMWESIHNVSKRIALCKSLGLNHGNLCKIERIRHQLKAILLGRSIQLKSISSCLTTQHLSLRDSPVLTDPDRLRRCLVKSFPSNIARLESPMPAEPTGAGSQPSVPTQYIVEESRLPIHIHPTSCLFGLQQKHGFILFHDLIETTKIYAHTVTVIEQSWIHEYHPQLTAKCQPVTPTRSITSEAIKAKMITSSLTNRFAAFKHPNHFSSKKSGHSLMNGEKRKLHKRHQQFTSPHASWIRKVLKL